MLTFDIKKKIDTLRDILVGKIPDPKAQVEQITIAMIYKFLDDMDTDAMEFGGREFFIDEYEKYAWSNIMSPQMGGRERIIRYAEGMEAMQRNPNLPKLFRSIFKNAYLPYRDSETLNLFLAEINEFKYDNSEDLGNAFEYLLSIMGSQGDAGQFRTPRHIIDMIVEIVRPKKDEKVLDPACGTAGFLISAYKHIIKNNKDDLGNVTLSAQERGNLTNNFVGYDISPDMVRLSQVNMYLHRFLEPKIFEKDTLTDKEVWQKQYFDVILANPPFMTPKGGIIPHKLFRVQANRSEVLFVDYIMENLAPNGRAGIIVPEGIIFQSGKAYTALRKMLVEENYLYGVISLPSGIFNPYAGVKTSILLIDRAIAKQTDKIIFLKMESDGFDLGAQRRKLNHDGDIAEIIKFCKAFRTSILQKTEFTTDSNLALIATKDAIKEKDYNLVGDRYKEAKEYITDFPMVKLGDVCEILDNIRKPLNKSERKSGDYPYYGATGIVDYVNDYIFDEPLVLIGEDGAKWREDDKTAFAISGKTWVNNHAHVLKPNCNLLNDKYLIEIINIMDLSPIITGVTVPKLTQEALRKIKIPLPPIEIQNEIMAEIEEYQKIIDGAKQVVNNYKPTFFIDLKWEKVKLGDICQIERGGSPRPINDYITDDEEGYNWIKIGDVAENDIYITKTKQKIRKEGIKKSRKVIVGDLILSNSMSFGRPYILKIEGYIHDGWLLIRDNKRCFNKLFLCYLFSQNIIQEQFKLNAVGGVVNNLNSELVRSIEIFLPSLEIQNKIVAEIEEEQKAVEACKKLIEICEQKIKDKISVIWGERK